MELFDRPYPYAMTKGSFGKEGDNIASFSIDPSKNDIVDVELQFRSDTLYVNFLRRQPLGSERLDITGQGNAGRIFATVMDIVKRFVTSTIVDQIIIIAMEEGSGARGRIYRMLLNKYADRMGYHFYETVKKSHGEIWFSLERKDDVF